MKRIISILIAVIMVVSVQTAVLGLTLEETENTVSEVSSKNFGNSTKSARKAKSISENDKYIFAALTSASELHSSAVQIYDKTTGELLQTLSMTVKDDNKEVYAYCPINDVYLVDDVLYVQWGNVINLNTSGTYSSAGRANDDTWTGGSAKGSPVIAYDVAEVKAPEDEVTNAPKSVIINSATGTGTAPWVTGARTYIDDNNVYVFRPSGSTPYFYVYSIDDTTKYLNGDISSLTYKTRFKVSKNDNILTQFIIKEGWLIEVLKNNNGLYGTYTDTYNLNVDKDTVRVYDLSSIADIYTVTDVTSNLRAEYTTGDGTTDEIKDIDISDDYLYVSTSNGIEIVPLANAKTATNDNIATLSVSDIINSLGETNGTAGVYDLDIADGMLFAAYAGKTVYEYSVAEATDTGAVVIYDITNPANPEKVAQQTVSYGAAQLSVNQINDKVMVLHDNMAAAETYRFVSLSAYNYKEDIPAEPSLELLTTLDVGTQDIKVNVTNEEDAQGVVIVALYKGNELAKVFKTDAQTPAPKGELNLGSYNVTADITRIKAMFFKDMELTIQPLCASDEVK